MRWAGYAARMGDTRMRTDFWLIILKRTDHSEDLCVDESIILKSILGKYGGCGLGSSG
jgi:hypothetical protein